VRDDLWIFTRTAAIEDTHAVVSARRTGSNTASFLATRDAKFDGWAMAPASAAAASATADAAALRSTAGDDGGAASAAGDGSAAATAVDTAPMPAGTLLAATSASAA